MTDMCASITTPWARKLCYEMQGTVPTIEPLVLPEQEHIIFTPTAEVDTTLIPKEIPITDPFDNSGSGNGGFDLGDIDLGIDWKPGDIIGGIQQWFTDIISGITEGISGGIGDIGAGFKGISTGIGEGLSAGGESTKGIITFAVPVLIVLAIAGIYLKFK